MTRANMQESKRNKDDEYFTRLEYIEGACDKYDWENKTIFCPCDDPSSAFITYFTHKNSRVFSSSYPDGLLYLNGRRVGSIDENGDCMGSGCSNFYGHIDVVCTNPPFSLIRKFAKHLISFHQPFLLLGPSSMTSSKLMLEPDLQIIQARHHAIFDTPNGAREQPIYWYAYKMPKMPPANPVEFHTLEWNKANNKHLRQKQYQIWTNGVLEVPFSDAVPSDYPGIMAVPPTFMAYMDKDRWEALDSIVWTREDGTQTFQRVLIRNRLLQDK